MPKNYDGVNEVYETDGNNLSKRSYIHGISYVDERLMMFHFGTTSADDRPYYYVLDRMYDVWLLLDRAGAIVERYCYDEYGRLRLRESAGRGDMDNDSDLDTTDSSRVTAAKNGTIWDPRADLDDDGDVDATDQTLYNTKDDNWPPQRNPTVAQAFSDVGNPFGFQGRVQFALDTPSSATDGKLMLIDHRARMNDPITGRWITRDPLGYDLQALAENRWIVMRWVIGDQLQGPERMDLYMAMQSDPVNTIDPLGLICHGTCPPVLGPPGQTYGPCQVNIKNCQDCCDIMFATCLAAGRLDCTCRRTNCYSGCSISIGGRYWPDF